MIYKPVSSWGRTNDKDFKYCHLCGDILSGVRGVCLRLTGGRDEAPLRSLLHRLRSQISTICPRPIGTCRLHFSSMEESEGVSSIFFFTVKEWIADLQCYNVNYNIY